MFYMLIVKMVMFAKGEPIWILPGSSNDNGRISEVYFVFWKKIYKRKENVDIIIYERNEYGDARAEIIFEDIGHGEVLMDDGDLEINYSSGEAKDLIERLKLIDDGARAILKKELSSDLIELLEKVVNTDV